MKGGYDSSSTHLRDGCDETRAKSLTKKIILISFFNILYNGKSDRYLLSLKIHDIDREIK